MAKKTTTVATKNQFSLEDIPGALATVDAKIKELKGNIDAGKRTNGKLDGFTKSVFDEDDLNVLIRMHASVVARQKAFDDSRKALLEHEHVKGKITRLPSFSISGASAEAWENDIAIRLREVATKKELDKLNQVRKKLSEHLSEEEKFKNLLGEIGSILTEE